MRIAKVLIALISLLAFEGEVYPDKHVSAGMSIYGTYTDGCLLKGRQFKADDYDVFLTAFDSPNRFAHQNMHDFLKRLNDTYKEKFSDWKSFPILIGEMSRDGGGVTLPHFSHQIGLDVDFYFFNDKPNKTEWPHDYIDTNKGVGQEFNLKRNWWLVGFLSTNPSTNRIFVAPEVKVSFCESKGKLESWRGREDDVLSKLRPWYGHRDHFHLRLSCPNDEKDCFEKGMEIPKGDGCADAYKWMKDPKHSRVRPRSDYKRKGKYNSNCWKDKPNVIAYPGAEKLIQFE